MKSVWKTLVGLIVDDWWLALGVAVSLLIAPLSLKAGLEPHFGGLELFVLLACALVLSLRLEYRRTTRQRRTRRE